MDRRRQDAKLIVEEVYDDTGEEGKGAELADGSDLFVTFVNGLSRQTRC